MGPADPEVALRAAEAGAEVVRARFGTPLSRLEKSALDFATDADIEAEQAIREVLRAARPTDAQLGEELGASAGGASSRTWLIDPLCGTVNFAAQTPPFAVNVALRDGPAIAVAAVADPLTGEVFWTDGRAAYQRADGADRRLVPSAATSLVDVNVDSPFRNAGRGRTVDVLADPAFLDAFHPRVASTSLVLAWVAAGRRAAYLTGGDVSDSVHFAAGIALCRAAGCLVTGWSGGPLHAGPGGLIAAADEPTHGALLAIAGRVTGGA